jgi:pilus assembly protein CpaF
MESDVITMQELFEFKMSEVNKDGVVVGELVPTGLRPLFLRKFEKRGVTLPLGLFGTQNAHSIIERGVAQGR